MKKKGKKRKENRGNTGDRSEGQSERASIQRKKPSLSLLIKAQDVPFKLLTTPLSCPPTLLPFLDDCSLHPFHSPPLNGSLSLSPPFYSSALFLSVWLVFVNTTVSVFFRFFPYSPWEFFFHLLRSPCLMAVAPAVKHP